MRFEYISGSLFEGTKEGDIIIHSGNCQANWGKGFAKQLALLYPSAYIAHQNNKRSHNIGDYEVINNQINYIVTLFTSSSFFDKEHLDISCNRPKFKASGNSLSLKYCNKYKDNPVTINENTEKALRKVKWFLKGFKEVKLPKINSGLLEVPWEITEKTITRVYNDLDIVFKVYSI